MYRAPSNMFCCISELNSSEYLGNTARNSPLPSEHTLSISLCKSVALFLRAYEANENIRLIHLRIVLLSAVPTWCLNSILPCVSTGLRLNAEYLGHWSSAPATAEGLLLNNSLTDVYNCVLACIGRQ